MQDYYYDDSDNSEDEQATTASMLIGTGTYNNSSSSSSSNSKLNSIGDWGYNTDGVTDGADAAWAKKFKFQPQTRNYFLGLIFDTHCRLFFLYKFEDAPKRSATFRNVSPGRLCEVTWLKPTRHNKKLHAKSCLGSQGAKGRRPTLFVRYA